MVAILDEVFMSGFRYLGVTVVGSAHFPNTFDMVEKGINLHILLILWLLRNDGERGMWLLMPLSASCRFLSVVSVWEW